MKFITIINLLYFHLKLTGSRFSDYIDEDDYVEHEEITYLEKPLLRKYQDSFPSCPSIELHNGKVEYLSSRKDVASFYCHHPFILVGDGVTVCKYGHWSPQPPTCASTNCTSLPPPQHGKVTMSEKNSTATFICDSERYQLVGPTTLICTEQGWNDQVPTCRDLFPSCPPIQLDNGELGYFPVEQKVVFFCYFPFAIVGNRTTVCNSGIWSSQPPICPRINCTSLFPPEHGELKMFRRNTTATFKCYSERYQLVGPRTLICTEKGWNNQVPTCRDLFPSCPPIELHNGNLEYFSDEQKVMFSCHHPFILVGDNSAVCHSGNWSSLPPTCASTNCTSLSPPEHGELTMSERNTTATFKCDSERYQLVGPTTLICTEKGWNNLMPTCRDLFPSCPPIELHNGELEYFPDEQKVAFYCNFPFYIVGNKTAVCNSRHWSSQPPTCASTNCTSLSPPEYSKFTMSEDNTTATFKCDSERYQLVGPSKLICTKQGWNNQVPTCRDLFPSCPPIELHNGEVVYFPNEQEVMFSCHHPFILVGEKKVVCKSGTWSSQPPTCASTNCTSLSSPEHGRLTMSEDNTTATITCDIVRYQLVGSTTLICTEQGWNNQVPTCRDLFPSCPPINLHNGEMEYVFYEKLEVIFYCNPPFIQVGDEGIYISECISGNWSSQPPTCASTNCTSLSPPEHSTFTMSEDNTTATFKCDSERYQLVGPTTLICIEKGWNNQMPTCRDLFPSCPPIELHNGELEYFPDEQKVMFSCHHPFNLVGNNTTVCDSRHWSSQPPTCANSYCPSLPPLEHGIIKMSEDNTTASLTCVSTRYQLNGAESIICTEKGWNNQMPTCQETDTSSNLFVYILVIISTLVLISIALAMRWRHKNYLGRREDNLLSDNNYLSLHSNEF